MNSDCQAWHSVCLYPRSHLNSPFSSWNIFGYSAEMFGFCSSLITPWPEVLELALCSGRECWWSVALLKRSKFGLQGGSVVVRRSTRASAIPEHPCEKLDRTVQLQQTAGSQELTGQPAWPEWWMWFGERPQESEVESCGEDTRGLPLASTCMHVGTHVQHTYFRKSGEMARHLLCSLTPWV